MAQRRPDCQGKRTTRRFFPGKPAGTAVNWRNPMRPLILATREYFGMAARHPHARPHFSQNDGVELVQIFHAENGLSVLQRGRAGKDRHTGIGNRDRE